MILPVTDIKILIAYFSRQGKNYMMEKWSRWRWEIQKYWLIRFSSSWVATCLRYLTLQEYPEEYIDTTRVARNELRTVARPELAEYVKKYGGLRCCLPRLPQLVGNFSYGSMHFSGVSRFLRQNDYSLLHHQRGAE